MPRFEKAAGQILSRGHPLQFIDAMSVSSTAITLTTKAKSIEKVPEISSDFLARCHVDPTSS
jgi:hypothetical protein